VRRALACLVLTAIIAGCGSSYRAPPANPYGSGSAGPVHVVQRGDTLYSIAFRYGLDYRKVAAANGIGPPYTIYPGQRLVVTEWAQVTAPVAQGGAAPAPAVPPGAPPAGAVVVTAVPEITATAGSATAPPIGAATPTAAASAPSPRPINVPRPIYETPSAAGSAPPPAAGPVPQDNEPVPPPATAPEIVVNRPVPVTAAPGPSTPVPPATESPPTRLEEPAAPSPATPPRPEEAASPAPTAPELAVNRPVPVTGLPDPGPAPVSPPPTGKVGAWLWPASGPVTRGYSPSVHKGIDIGGARGDPVYAVADGVVVYAGSGIVGFGELIILKHNDTYLSAYGHNDRLLVAEGAQVAAGQQIAQKGSSGTDDVKLHFEIRRDGKPIDPLTVLPGR